MWKETKTLLDLGRIPTRDEMREFFRANDWTAAKPFDFEKWDEGKVSDFNKVKNIFNSVWNESARELGQLAPSSCYTDDYPPELLKSGVGDIVCGQVTELIHNPELLGQIFDSLSAGEESDDSSAEDEELTDEEMRATDSYVKTFMDGILDIIGYEETVAASKEIGTPEDFSKRLVNYPKNDFEKKYNHAEAKTKLVYSNPALQYEAKKEEIDSYTPEELAENSAFVEGFFETLDDTNKKILKLMLLGYKQAEIADKLGFANHSTVSKRIKLIREKYIEYDPEFKI